MSAPFDVADLAKYFAYDPTTGVVRRIGPLIKAPLGFKTTDGYIQFNAGGRKLFAHRIAWAMTHGFWPDRVDHANSIRTDNRIANLRAATSNQNSFNSRHRRIAGSGLRGVYLLPGKSLYQSHIKTGQGRVYLGSFQSAESAAMAYDRAAIYFHGEYAVTNFSKGLL